MQSKKKRRKLSGEILEFLLVSFLVAAFVFYFLYATSGAIANTYLADRGIFLEEIQSQVFQAWLRSICLAASAIIFIILFLSLFSQRISYLMAIIRGVEALEEKRMDYQIPLDGCDELTELAETINELSMSQRELAQKKQEMQEEREAWIRSMSHDIRTPLTSILSYTEFLEGKGELGQQEIKAYLSLVQSRAEQIRELTDRLLGKSHGKREKVQNMKLLMEQLAAEWEELLEDQVPCSIDLSGCEAVNGEVDIQNLRRIFDNLISNVEKYADPEKVVELEIQTKAGILHLRQRNKISGGEFENADSHRIGLEGMKTMLKGNGGRADICCEDGEFEIQIWLPFMEEQDTNEAGSL